MKSTASFEREFAASGTEIRDSSADSNGVCALGTGTRVRPPQHFKHFREAFIHLDFSPVFNRKAVIIFDQRIRSHCEEESDDRHTDAPTFMYRIVQRRSAVTSAGIQIGSIGQDSSDDADLLLPAGQMENGIA